MIKQKKKGFENMKEMTLKEIQKLLGYAVKIVAEKPAEVGSVVDVADTE